MKMFILNANGKKILQGSFINGDRFTVDFDDYREYEVEVIGNIFDNAELLEVE